LEKYYKKTTALPSNFSIHSYGLNSAGFFGIGLVFSLFEEELTFCQVD
jgi:hypothetical protein